MAAAETFDSSRLSLMVTAQAKAGATCLPAATACFAIVTLASGGWAQEYRATLAGEVADPSGSAVEAAKVTATSVERSVTYESATNSAGRYAIPFLPPGRYNISVQKTGFRKFVREGVPVLAADKLAIDI